MKKPITFLLVKHRRQRREKGADAQRTITQRTGFSLASIVMLVLAFCFAVTAWQYLDLIRDLPMPQEVQAAFDPATGIYDHPTRIFDRTGQVLLAELTQPDIQREPITLPTGPAAAFPVWADAFVATLQPDLWTSPGYTLTDLHPEQHPTIAQQLVFDPLLSSEPADLRRALRERMLAARVTTLYGPRQVLEWYLNTASFGHYAYGLDSAARTYFGKHAVDLTLAESAMLAGVSLAPALNPWDSPAGANTARQKVLEQMAALGTITQSEYQQALLADIPITPSRPDLSAGWDLYTRTALEQASELISREQLERGGLTVFTSQDADLQAQSDCAQYALLSSLESPSPEPVDREASRREGYCPAAALLPVLPPSTTLPASSLTSITVALDPANGQVLALSSIGSAEGQAALTPLDAGTLITPFIYLNAFASGFSPSTLVWDVPRADLKQQQSDSRGPITVREALAGDALSAAVELHGLAGVNSFTKLMDSLGVADIYSDTLPTLRADPVSLARSYGMLANGGVLAGKQPVYILQIQDGRGNKLFQAQEAERLAVVSPQLAYLVSQVLVDDGVHNPVLTTLLGTSADTAVKTGQVADGRSAWTAGYDPNLVILSRVASVDGNTAVDLRWPVGIWRAIMQYSLAARPTDPWVEPPGISHLTVCYPSGLLPDADCPETRPEIFISGNEPDRSDDLYRTAWVNIETGGLATVFTPTGLVEKRRYLQVPPAYFAWVVENAIPQMPVNYDPIPPLLPEPDLHITLQEQSEQVSGVVKIIGTAGGESLAGWRVDVGAGLYPESWVQVGTGGTSPVKDGLLAQWDTANLTGVYIIRLQMVTVDNLLRTVYLPVSVGK